MDYYYFNYDTIININDIIYLLTEKFKNFILFV